MDASSASVFATRMVTVSPSFQRRVGAGTEPFTVKWIRVAVPDRGVMLAAIGRPSGAGPFPVVLLLHGTHGFVPQYVQLAQDLARAGFLAVAGCWFSGSENPNRVAPRKRPYHTIIPGMVTNASDGSLYIGVAPHQVTLTITCNGEQRN